jgi:hypothetical protein
LGRRVPERGCVFVIEYKSRKTLFVSTGGAKKKRSLHTMVQVQRVFVTYHGDFRFEVGGVLGEDQILARFKGDVEVIKDISEEEGEGE